MRMYAPENATPPAQGYQVLTFPRGKKMRSEGTRWPCPQCGCLCGIRNSQMLSRTMRETNYICENPECACSFVVNAQVDRLLNPGGTPDPSLNIPLSSHIRRDVLRVVLEHADEAAHKPQFTKPVTGDLFAGIAPPG